MTEPTIPLIEIAIGILITLIFAIAEIAVTIWANDKTAEKIMKHIDEDFRELSDKIAEVAGTKKRE
jgi:hypothetical protein